MSRRVLTVAMLCVGWPVCLLSQIRAVPGGVMDGKVVVRVYVTLRDEEIPYYPVSGLPLRFMRSATDSLAVTTDDAGSLTTLLPAGQYRIVSARDVVWRGNRYSWSVPVLVAPGMQAIELPMPSGSPTDARRVATRESSPTGAGGAVGGAAPARPAGMAASLPKASGSTVPSKDVPNVLTIPHVGSAPALAERLTGKLAVSVAAGGFRQKEPNDGAPASLPTSADVSYDDKNLYVMFECVDEPSRIRARLAKREDIGEDDQVLVYLDTFRDRRRAYVFSVNPLGVQRDGIRTEGQGTDYTYDTMWRSDARITNTGFTVLITIPFKSLRFARADVQTWGIALGRYVARTQEYAYWPYITGRVDGFVNQLADLSGIKKVSPGRNVQVVPYAATTGSDNLDTKLAAFRRTDDTRVGADAKVVLRNAFTLDATVNPDFSQVESDEPQVTINKRFEVFFPEKRPFFIENSGFFATPENLFFSRRIIDPQFGGRFTGKAGPWAIGALVSDDRAQGLQNADDSLLANKHAIAGVVRVQREIGKESVVGVLATNREFASSFDRVVALDTRLKFGGNWSFTGQAIYSEDRKLDGDSLHGTAFNAHLSRSSRNFTYSGGYLDRSPGFKAPLGFIKRTDIRQTDQYASYLWRPTTGPLVAFGPVISGSADWNYARQLQDWDVEPELAFYFRRPIQIMLSRDESFEAFDGLEFREYLNKLSLYSSVSKLFSLYAYVSVGKSPNYSPPADVAPFLARSVSVSTGFSYRPARRLRLDQSFYYSQLGAGEDKVFTNNISRTKVNLQLTRSISVRAIADYNTLVPTARIDAELSKRLIGDLLFTYLLNPFTALYVGFTDRYENIDLGPDDARFPQLEITPYSPRWLVTQSASTRTSRQLFMKLSYRLGL